MSKLFTLREAQESLAQLSPLLEQAMEAQRESEALGQELEALQTRIMLAGGAEIDPVKAAQLKVGSARAAETARGKVKEIEASGCLVKDLSLGLLDFPALLGGSTVYLCWKLGEPRIEFWHGLEEGFAGRRPIRGEFDSPEASGRPN